MSVRSSGGDPAGAFATVLRRHREAAGLTQAELAERAGLGVRTVSNLERGVNTSPYPSTVRLLADALGLPSSARDHLVATARRDSGATRAASPVGGYLGATPAGRLVARDVERAAITAALDAAAAGQSQVVLLAGEPGIGKTRLAQEASVQARERGFLVAGARCFEQQSEAPFAPLFEAFETLYEHAPPSVRGHVAQRWPSLTMLLPDRFPAAGPSAHDTPDAALRLHWAAAGFVRELAEHRPVAILLDDLHWADVATAEAVTHLARHVTIGRVLVLGTYRDAELGRAHPVRALAHSLHRDRLTQAIALGRLDREATARLIADRLDGAEVSAELAAVIHRSSDGNPFFIVEILRALLERDDIARVDGRWTGRASTGMAVPASVGQAIGERVARLSPVARGVVEAASVLGVVFDDEDVALVDDREPVLEQALDEALALGLLTLTDGGYAFDHSLTQQALYAGLSPARRRRLHRVVGEGLEQRPPDVRTRRSAEIARHLDAGGVPGRAIRFFLLAGDLAAGLYSHAEAVRLYGRALELARKAGDSAATPVALLGLGRAELTVAQYDESVAHLSEAADAFARAGDVAARLGAEGLIAQAQLRRGEGEQAAGRLSELVAEIGASPLGPVPGAAALGSGLARVRLALRQHSSALEAAEHAMRLAQAEGAIEAEAEAAAMAGTVLLFLDRPDDAVGTLERAIALARRVDAVTIESETSLALHWTLTMRTEFDRARAVGERGLAVARRSGDTDAEAAHAADLGLTFYYQGEWTLAQSYLERGVELTRAGSPTLFSGIPPAYLGVLRGSQGDAAAARACYDEAATAPDLQTFAFDAYVEARRAELDVRDGDPSAALSRLERWLDVEVPTRIHDVMLLSVGAQACLALGDHERAEGLVTRALRRAAATRNEVDGIDALRLRGCCLLAAGRRAEARACLDEALARAVARRHPAAEARAHRDLARLFEATGDRVGARDAMRSARELFGKLGAAHEVAALRA